MSGRRAVIIGNSDGIGLTTYLLGMRAAVRRHGVAVSVTAPLVRATTRR
jgi:hypothetical protein